MKDLFIKNCFDFINNRKKLDDYAQIKIKYGLEVMYNFVVKTSLVIILSVLFHCFIEVLFIFLFYGLIRTFAHGIHCTSNLFCWIFTLSSYLLSIFVIRFLDISYHVSILICVYSVFIILLFSPSDTKYRPLINKSKRIKFKILSTLIAIIYSYIILFSNFKYSNCMVISLILTTIVINPISYKLLGLRRNNYKFYI